MATKRNDGWAHEATDDELMAALAGDPGREAEALRELTLRHQDRVRRRLRRFVRCPAQLDDLVQDVFVRVYAARRRYDIEGSARFTTWLDRVARNTAIDAHRRSSRRPIQAQDPTSFEWDAHPGPTPSRRLSRQEDRSAVRRAVQALPERDREAVALRFEDGLAYKDIASRIGGSAAAAKQRVWRALQRLRDLLGGEASLRAA